MAIYKNREVFVIGPSPMANTPTSINVSFKDGSHENVSLSQVKFTDEEKKILVKNYPSQYDNVDTISEDDLKAVRLGVAPSFDPAAKEQARAHVQNEKQREVAAKQSEDLRAQQKAELDKELNAKNAPAKQPQPVVTDKK